MLALLASVAFVVLYNLSFLRTFAVGRDPHVFFTWWLVIAVAIALTAIQTAMLLFVLQRPTAKPLLAVLFVANAAVGHFIRAYGIYLDPSMMSNVLHTNVDEALELISPSLIANVVLLGGVPIVLLAWIRIAPSSLRDALVVRPLYAILAVGIAVVVLLTVGRSFESLMRNSPDIRHLATPLNYLWSLPVAELKDRSSSSKPLTVIGLDAHRARSANARPVLMVLVIGEASRAANWQLDGYTRATTPELAARNDLIN